MNFREKVFWATSFFMLVVAAGVAFVTILWHDVESRRRRKFKEIVASYKTQTPKTQRNIWVKKRSEDWWSSIVKKEFSDDDWLENFRVTKSTFEYVVNVARPFMAPKRLWVRPPLTVEKKVAIAMYKLASCSEYRVVGNTFGVAKCTVHSCVYQFCRIFAGPVAERFIRFPTEEEAREISDRIFQHTNYPQAYAAIDGTHIPILPPKAGYTDFTNRKGWQSIVLQGIVDDKRMFRDVSCKMPGSVHDATVLRQSKIYEMAMGGNIPTSTRDVGGVQIPLHILGDPAYPLQNWLLKGFTGHVNGLEENYNVYHSSARMMVEHAFGRLKSRWRILMKRCDINYLFMPKVVITCCVLHNICELQKDVVLAGWLQESLDDRAFPQPRRLPSPTVQNDEAKRIRDVIKSYLSDNFPLRLSHLH